MGEITENIQLLIIFHHVWCMVKKKKELLSSYFFFWILWLQENSQMLRLNLYGSIVSSPIEVNKSCRSWIILSNKATIVCRRNIRVKALKDGMNGGTNGSGLGGRSWDPGLEIEVPFEQRPVCSQFFVFIPGLIHLIQSAEINRKDSSQFTY